MKYKRGDFVRTAYNEIGVVLKVEPPTTTSWYKSDSYLIRVASASGESNWFTGEHLYPLVDQVSETTNEV